MNITDFVSSIKLNLEDLENTGKQGYIKGITDIIVKNLNNLEQCFRPIHCSDMKREVLYIKENNKWEKETEDNLYLKIVSNSMNGLTKEEGEKNINKIISNVAKEVIIDKVSF